MAERARLSDPGGEVVNAPIGSEDWAKRWRLEVQAVWDNIPKEPARFVRFYDLGNQHRVWTLLNKADGGRFRSFDEFCLAKKPWGLSASPEEVAQRLALVKGHKAAKLERVSEPQTHAGPGRGHKSAESKGKKTVPRDAASFSRYTESRLRAINRAPESVRKLYEQDKLSQVWAAKLGPKNPSPEVAAKVVEIAHALRGAHDRKTSDGIVKRMLGARSPSLHERLMTLARKMTPSGRRRAMDAIAKL